MNREKLKEYQEANKERFLEELFELLRIPSVSADSAYKADTRRAAEFIVEKLKDAGIKEARMYETDGHPIVYGEVIIDEKLPTVLVYGHYDVQPPEPLELWETEPFDPVIRKTDLHPEGAIFARGSCDDKGQMYMHVKAIESMLATGQLPCNVKLMIEGEEESGSVNLPKFCRDYADMLSCDVVLISDTSIIANDTPSITTGLRGLSYIQVEVTGPNRDLHSGVYGGAVANPLNILSDIVSKLMDEDGRITIPGFYDDVLEYDAEERKQLNAAPFDENQYKIDLDVEELKGEKGYTTIERASIRPTLDLNGIWGGYQGEGAKTVLPSIAGAKISMRLVPNQDPDKIANLAIDYIKKIAPASVKVNAFNLHGGDPVVLPVDSLEYEAAYNAMKDTFGKEPIPVKGGGSIPIVALFEEVLNVKTVLMGFGLDSDNIHSPNEHYGLFNFYKGIETIPLFYHYFVNQ